MKRAFTFPGQGSQFAGMGKPLADAFKAAADVFAEVDDALSQNLCRIIFEGPEEDLRLTENAQPALMAVSMAAMRVLESDGHLLTGLASLAAGHSLGEYSALAAAGSISLVDTARLLKRRGQAMQRAVPVGEGAMAALLGLDFEAAREVVAEAALGEVCTTANDNAPGQVVISGHLAAVERAIELAKAKGARRGILLPVSAPFHCSLMQPAAEEMAEALKKVEIGPPAVPIVANVRAESVTEPGEIRKLLVEQVTGSVRWRESVGYMAASGIEQLVEVGAGKVLTGLARRIDRELETVSIQTPEDLENFAATL
ncbi:MAG: ACP S-malonyltransferase [Sphingomonadales bacterium]